MRETCSVIITGDWTRYYELPSAEEEVCGKPAVDYRYNGDGIKYWLCAEHWDDLAFLVSKTR